MLGGFRMARRLYRTENCIEYEKSVLSGRPRINVKLFNMRLEEYPSIIPLIVDTGFDGSILVTGELYEFFQIGELPRKYWRTYRSIVGPITMRVAKVLASIEPSISVETYVETPLAGRGKLLMGRELLNNLTIVLDGPVEQLCIVTREK